MLPRPFARARPALAALLVAGALQPASAQVSTDGVVFVRIVGDVQVARGHEPRVWRETVRITDTEIATGSGFLVSPSGYVITNRHVIEGGRVTGWLDETPIELVATVTRIQVLLPPPPGADETQAEAPMDATVVAEDPELDLAVLYVGGAELPYLRLGDSAAMRLGDAVTIVGFPLGRGVELEGSPEPAVPSVSVTSGTVSGLRGGTALGATWPVRYVQTTAALNPGNSGGPMLDEGGNVVGVAVSRVAKADSIGFAIPVELVRRFLEARGLDGVLPIRGLDLSSAYEAPAKGIRLRVPAGFEDASPRRVRVDSGTSLGQIALRIDRLVSPWKPAEIERELLAGRTFETEAMTAFRRGPAAFTGPPGSYTGVASEAAAGGPVRMLYAIQKVGEEWVVARYVGPADVVAFSRSALEASLGSLEAAPLLSGKENATRPTAFDPAGPGLYGWKPEAWLIEDGEPLACEAIGEPTSGWSASPEQDYTAALRLARRHTNVTPETAAACVAGRDGARGGAYHRSFGVLGLTYSVDGVFVQLGEGDLLQLEMLAPMRTRAIVEPVFRAWLSRYAPEGDVR